MLTKQKAVSWISGNSCAAKFGSVSGIQIEKDRLDTFLDAHVYGVEKLSALWNVMIFVFTIFHGWSNVERGFNINDDIVIENLKIESLIAQWLIYGHMHAKKVRAHGIF